MFKHLFFLIGSLFLFLGVYAQNAPTPLDTVILTTGKIYVGTVSNPDSSMVTITNASKKWSKIKRVHSDEVFCIQYASGKADTFYYQDEALMNYLTVEEMAIFILGEQDAIKYYKAPISSLIGLSLGVTAGYFMYDQFWIAGVPLVYTIIAGTSQVKVKNVGFREAALLAHPAYQEGFIKIARSKKAFRAFASSLIGAALGVTIGHLTH